MKTTRQRCIGLFLLLTVCASLAGGFPSNSQQAQKPLPPRCPSLRIVAPDGHQMLEDIWTFTALVEEFDPKAKLSYSWTVDRGKINTGQGTAAITIDRPDLQKGALVILDIEGFPEGCASQAKVSIIS